MSISDVRYAIEAARDEAAEAEDAAGQAASQAEDATRSCATALDELGDVESALDDWEALGDFDEVQVIVENSDGGTEMSDMRTTLEDNAVDIAALKESIELLTVLNRKQAEMIKGARLALIADPDTGLSQSQADYIEWLRDTDSLDNVEAVEPVVETQPGPVGGPIVGWDGNGSPIVE